MEILHTGNIAFEFTGNSVEPHCLHEKIINIIQLCAFIRIFVDHVISDLLLCQILAMLLKRLKIR
jgi:hypothetical protein